MLSLKFKSTLATLTKIYKHTPMFLEIHLFILLDVQNPSKQSCVDWASNRGCFDKCHLFCLYCQVFIELPIVIFFEMSVCHCVVFILSLVSLLSCLHLFLFLFFVWAQAPGALGPWSKAPGGPSLGAGGSYLQSGKTT